VGATIHELIRQKILGGDDLETAPLTLESISSKEDTGSRDDPRRQRRTLINLLKLFEYRSKEVSERGRISTFASVCDVVGISRKTAKECLLEYDPSLSDNWEDKSYKSRAFVDNLIKNYPEENLTAVWEEERKNWEFW
jgi:hypothetical protein